MSSDELHLSKKKFINTASSPYTTTKAPLAQEDAITVGVFFDAILVRKTVPFWITFQRRNPIGLALDKLCKAANVPNTNNSAASDADKWFVFCLTSGKSIAMDMALDPITLVEDVAVDGDVWFVGKGPTLPSSVPGEAATRLRKISSRKVPPQSTHDELPADSTTPSSAGRVPVPTPPVKSEHQPITVFLHFPELEGKVSAVHVASDALISDLLDHIKMVEPEATKNGLRVMFCEKYVRALAHDTVRGIPLHDGSSIDVCTGRYLSENEMTLYLAERRLREVTAEVASHQSKDGAGPVTRVQRAHWNERLMKALTLLDSLQEVPEDIRMRRKASVKAVMAEQDRLMELNVV